MGCACRAYFTFVNSSIPCYIIHKMVEMKNAPILVLSGLNIAIFMIALSLDDILGLGSNGLQGITIGRWAYLVSGALGLFITFFEHGNFVYYTSLASTSLAVMFGIIAAALFGQIGVDLSTCSVGSACYKHRCTAWGMFSLSFLAILINGMLTFLLHKEAKPTEEPNNRRQEQHP